ncbi:thiol-disulfide isomerase/thioredoxin [Marmoricola sp. URHA0025 HA25]
MSRRLLVPALLAAVVASVSGCSNVGGTGDKGYIDGEGVITVLPVAKRKTPGEVSGETLDGQQLSLSSYAGKVVVVNVWGAWCPPCRAEADDLAAAAKELAPKGVVFLGINSRDSSKENARAFERTYDVPYPSIYDPSGRNLLAFHGTLSPNAIPSTVVIDQDGRVAASVLGEVTSKTTLVDLVDEVSK